MTQTTENLLEVIANKKNKQKDVATQYREAFNTIPDIEWRKINSAIAERWSKSGLVRVKTMAWQGKPGVGITMPKTKDGGEQATPVKKI